MTAESTHADCLCPWPWSMQKTNSKRDSRFKKLVFFQRWKPGTARDSFESWPNGVVLPMLTIVQLPRLVAFPLARLVQDRANLQQSPERFDAAGTDGRAFEIECFELFHFCEELQSNVANPSSVA